MPRNSLIRARATALTALVVPMAVLATKAGAAAQKIPNKTCFWSERHENGTGQMRYWSMCQNESLFTTKSAGCVYDAQVPVDKHGDYTIVTSLPGVRPSNATTRCGVAYIHWPKNGDGDGHLNDDLLIMRNMLSSPSRCRVGGRSSSRSVT
jgi:hypothetical protein